MGREDDARRWAAASQAALHVAAPPGARLDALNAQVVGTALDDLIALQYPLSHVTADEAAALLVPLCRLVSASPTAVSAAELASSKVLQLAAALVNRQGLAQHAAAVDAVLDLATSRLRARHHWLLADALRAIGAVAYDNAPACARYLDALLAESHGALLALVRSFGADAEIRRLAVACAGSLCAGAPPQRLTPHLPGVLSASIASLEDCAAVAPGDAAGGRLLCATYKALQAAIAAARTVPSLPTVLAAVKTHMFHGLDAAASESLGSSSFGLPRETSARYDLLAMPASARPPAVEQLQQAHGQPGSPAQASSPSGRRGSGARGRASLSGAPRGAEGAEGEGGALRLSSDSEVSDLGDFGLRARPERLAASKVRQCALQCLQAIAKTAPRRDLQAYWPSLVPDSQQPTQRTLLTSVLHDPNPKARLAAHAALAALLDGSRQYLSVASEAATPAAASAPRAQAFTPLSATVAGMIDALHAGLATAVRSEVANAACLAQALRTLAVLAANAPYDRLRPGRAAALLSLVGAHTAPEANGVVRDVNVRVAALTCIGSVLSARGSPLPEIAAMLSGDGAVVSARGVADMLAAREAVPLRVEACQVLCVMARGYYAATVASCWKEALAAVLGCAGDTDPTVRMYAVRAIEEIGKGVRAGDARSAPVYWATALDARVTALLGDPSPLVRAAACDCVSAIGQECFAGVPRDRGLLCITLVLGLNDDESPVVKAAACRALGVFVLWPSLREDLCFVADMANAVLQSVANENLNVRVRGSWALGNLCESLVALRDAVAAGGVDAHVEDAPTTLLLRLARAALTCARDNDKVRMNAVRALGNLLRRADAEFLSSSDGRTLALDMGDALVKASKTGPVKLRWNACYGIGNALRNPLLCASAAPRPHEHAPARAAWPQPAIDALVAVASDSKNFKVRINAVAALCVPARREDYGAAANPEVLAGVVSGLVAAFAAAESVDDFTEFKYQQTLQDQLGVSLCHVIGVSGASDRIALARAVAARADDFLRLVDRHIARTESGALQLSTADQSGENDHDDDGAVETIALADDKPATAVSTTHVRTVCAAVADALEFAGSTSALRAPAGLAQALRQRAATPQPM